MDASIEALCERISYHAVTRYVQRILGQKPIAQQKDGTRRSAALHCAAIGTTIAAVRRQILTPPVAAALIDGATRVRMPGFDVLLKRAENGSSFVSTIYVPGHRQYHAPQTRREGRRIGHQIGRRNRRRPAAAGAP